jgi:ketosteroid isomerase-like protein
MTSLAHARRITTIALLAVTTAVGLPAQDAVAKELMKLEDQWGAASIKRDGASVGRMLSDHFLSFTAKGVVSTKATLVASINSDTAQYVSGANSGYQVKVHGNTAVIIGVWTVTTKTAKGNSTQAHAWTDTWMKQADGRWLCIASQATRVK